MNKFDNVKNAELKSVINKQLNEIELFKKDIDTLKNIKLNTCKNGGEFKQLTQAIKGTTLYLKNDIYYNSCKYLYCSFLNRVYFNLKVTENTTYKDITTYIEDNIKYAQHEIIDKTQFLNSAVKIWDLLCNRFTSLQNELKAIAYKNNIDVETLHNITKLFELRYQLDYTYIDSFNSITNAKAIELLQQDGDLLSQLGYRELNILSNADAKRLEIEKDGNTTIYTIIKNGVGKSYGQNDAFTLKKEFTLKPFKKIYTVIG